MTRSQYNSLYRLVNCARSLGYHLVGRHYEVGKRGKLIIAMRVIPETSLGNALLTSLDERSVVFTVGRRGRLMLDSKKSQRPIDVLWGR